MYVFYRENKFQNVLVFFKMKFQFYYIFIKTNETQNHVLTIRHYNGMRKQFVSSSRARNQYYSRPSKIGTLTVAGNSFQLSNRSNCSNFILRRHRIEDPSPRRLPMNIRHRDFRDRDFRDRIFRGTSFPRTEFSGTEFSQDRDFRDRVFLGPKFPDRIFRDEFSGTQISTSRFGGYIRAGYGLLKYLLQTSSSVAESAGI